MTPPAAGCLHAGELQWRHREPGLFDAITGLSVLKKRVHQLLPARLARVCYIPYHAGLPTPPKPTTTTETSGAQRTATSMGPGRHAAVGALLAAALLLSAAVLGARAQAETEDEDFSYIPGADNGPENWGKIKAEWANCSVGRMQSPIDLSDECAKLVQSLGYLITSYRPAEATIVNTGHYVMVSFNGDAGSLVINGTTYNLKQLHWHTPSEHTIAGRRYDLELHLVHQTSANKTAVIGILYEIGAIKDPFLLWLEPSIRSIENTKDQPKDIGVVDPNGARGIGSVYYRYKGSLTTPPCTEEVVWTVVNKISPVAKDQVKLLRDALQDGNTMNARPLQEVNNRDISIFRPKLYDYY